MADFAHSCEECEPSSSSEPGAREKQVFSLLDHLRPPDSSDLSRKRNKEGIDKAFLGTRSLITNDRSWPRNDLKSPAGSSLKLLSIPFSSVRLVKNESL